VANLPLKCPSRINLRSFYPQIKCGKANICITRHAAKKDMIMIALVKVDDKIIFDSAGLLMSQIAQMVK
jgi:hypothetical protein